MVNAGQYGKARIETGRAVSLDGSQLTVRYGNELGRRGPHELPEGDPASRFGRSCRHGGQLAPP
jgi:hypothetical protein